MKRFLLILLSATIVSAVWAQDTPAPQLEITAKLGTGVEERELVAESTTFVVGDTAYLWMRLAGGPSDPVTVTWSIGEHTYDVELRVGAASWRTWSSKNLWKAGDWAVEVRDAAGTSLFRTDFSVTTP